MMKTSPRRPLILKRRKLPLPIRDAPGEGTKEEPKGSPAQQESGQMQPSKEVAEPDLQKFPTGIKIINHPTMPNTQVVAVPTNTDIQSIIAALTAKGKESGSSGPNKFILISSGRAPAHPHRSQPPNRGEEMAKRAEVVAESMGPKPATRDVTLPRPLGAHSSRGWELEGCAGSEAASCLLDDSLTNIQWLGKMSSDGLGSCSIKQEIEEKENRLLEQSQVKVEEPPATSTSWQDSISERPPYSYMAMIQFAINSTERKRMTLKDIYTWIEDHFPYFKHIAKPGWKNSIRHNLSLHDMFVRETSANGKVSFWTIHPDANRYLTLDQVFKPLDPGSPPSSEHLESQQKRPIPDLRRNLGIKAELPLSARRKMKPLLPRVNSYLVPIQFPVNQSLVLQPSVKVPLPLAASLMSSELVRHSKRVRIAPKVLLADEGLSPFSTSGSLKEEQALSGEGLSPLFRAQSVKEEDLQPMEELSQFTRPIKVESPPLEEWPSPFPVVKEEVGHPWQDPSLLSASRPKKTFTGLKSPPRGVSDMLVIKRRERREMSRSRRKQHLIPPCLEEPELLFPEIPGPSRQNTDLSFLPESSEPTSQLSHSQDEGGPFKTPVKDMLCKLPISSTPSKAVLPMTPDPWRLTPPNKDTGLDFSPVRTPQGSFTLLPDSMGLLDLSTTPLKNVPLFESPQELLNPESLDLVSDPFNHSPTSDPETPKPGSPEMHVSSLSANRSLTEGLVLDTMNDSLSKILLDISFPGLEEDPLGPDNISWSQFIPELR
ncbi:forkhead box protein M1 [Trichosurus vulpecula]|uniref:forkhead box protein M1 n=1 Tax=Trichosurus vulpecula TaxID=9337 RepID=UPI00186B291F|nr:forkhead box protein M1 [Trichosurus vulpecula]